MSWLIESYADDSEISAVFEQDYEIPSESDFFFETVEEILAEGANIDNTKAFMAGRKEFKKNLKLAKAAAKAGNNSEAKKYITKASSAITDLEKTIRETEGTAGSAVCGIFATGLLNLATQCVPLVGLMIGCGLVDAGVSKSIFDWGRFDFNTIAGCDAALEQLKAGGKMIAAGSATLKVSQLIGTVQSIIIFIKDIIKLVDEIKNPKTKTPDAINLYRNRLLQFCDKMKKQLDKVKKSI